MIETRKRVGRPLAGLITVTAGLLCLSLLLLPADTADASTEAAEGTAPRSLVTVRPILASGGTSDQLFFIRLDGVDGAVGTKAGDSVQIGTSDTGMLFVVQELELSSGLWEIVDSGCEVTTPNGVETEFGPSGTSPWSIDFVIDEIGSEVECWFINRNTDRANMKGNANCDSRVDLLDALAISQWYTGLKQNSGRCPVPSAQSVNLSSADVNDDGRVNLLDALIISQCEVGLTEGPCR